MLTPPFSTCNQQRTGDVDLSTDDVLDILLWIVVQAEASTLLVHLKFIQQFHFVNSNTTILGYEPAYNHTHTPCLF